MPMQQVQSYSGQLLSCRKIVLNKGNASEEPTTAERGVLLRLKNGKLQIQLEGFIQGPLAFSLEENRGMLVDDTEYYTLTAFDEVGREWTTKKLLLLESSLNLGNGSNKHTF